MSKTYREITTHTVTTDDIVMNPVKVGSNVVAHSGNTEAYSNAIVLGADAKTRGNAYLALGVPLTGTSDILEGTTTPGVADARLSVNISGTNYFIPLHQNV